MKRGAQAECVVLAWMLGYVGLAERAECAVPGPMSAFVVLGGGLLQGVPLEYQPVGRVRVLRTLVFAQQEETFLLASLFGSWLVGGFSLSSLVVAG